MKGGSWLVLWQRARFVCVPFVLVGGWFPVFKIHFKDSPFSSKCDLKFSIVSLHISLQDFQFVLRASPLRQPFLTSGGGDKLKFLYWNIWVGFKILVSRNLISVMEDLAVNLMVGWWLFTSSMNCFMSSLIILWRCLQRWLPFLCTWLYHVFVGSFFFPAKWKKFSCRISLSTC